MTTIQRRAEAGPRKPETPLSRAATLPSRYYLDPAILESEKERIFGRTWKLVARYDELQRIGDFVPVTAPPRRLGTSYALLVSWCTNLSLAIEGLDLQQHVGVADTLQSSDTAH